MKASQHERVQIRDGVSEVGKCDTLPCKVYFERSGLEHVGPPVPSVFVLDASELQYISCIVLPPKAVLPQAMNFKQIDWQEDISLCHSSC